MNRIYENGIRFGITFNKKHKKLFHGYGIRFGTQEIARYGWPKETMSKIAEIIYEISKLEVDDAKVHDLIASLPEKRYSILLMNQKLYVLKSMLCKNIEVEMEK